MEFSISNKVICRQEGGRSATFPSVVENRNLADKRKMREARGRGPSEQSG